MASENDGLAKVTDDERQTEEELFAILCPSLRLIQFVHKSLHLLPSRCQGNQLLRDNSIALALRIYAAGHHKCLGNKKKAKVEERKKSFIISTLIQTKNRHRFTRSKS